jgi:hypothetical protein
MSIYTNISNENNNSSVDNKRHNSKKGTADTSSSTGSFGNNSTSLALENLTMQYSNLLIKYQQAVLDYNTFLQYLSSNDISNNDISNNDLSNNDLSNNDLSNNDISNNNLSFIHSQAYWGKNIISQNTSSSVQQCMASCSQTTGCSGATYDMEASICYLISGKGKIVSADANHYAIIPKLDILLSNIENITNQLNYINSKIQQKIQSAEEENYRQNKENQKDPSSLIHKYKTLLEERKAIEANMKKFATLDEKNTITSLTVSQHYYSFLLLIFLVFVFIFILTYLSTSGSNKTPTSGGSYQNIQYGGELGYTAYYIVFALILLTLFIHFYMPNIYSIGVNK